MKIAVLSDIHGNYTALVEVLKFAKKQNVKSLFLLGDQLGYYYEAQEVYNAILKWPNHMISGNHEKLFTEYLNHFELISFSKSDNVFIYRLASTNKKSLIDLSEKLSNNENIVSISYTSA